MSASVLTAATALPGTASAAGNGSARGVASHLAAEVTYERIAAAIAAVTVRGAQVRVHWKNPFTGTPMGESAATMAADSSLSARRQAQRRRSLLEEVLGAIARVISGALGRSARRTGRDASYTALGNLPALARAGLVYTDASRREAVVRAFAAVRHAFIWDERSGRFIAR
jgi:hypothetical protein